MTTRQLRIFHHCFSVALSHQVNKECFYVCVIRKCTLQVQLVWQKFFAKILVEKEEIIGAGVEKLSAEK